MSLAPWSAHNGNKLSPHEQNVMLHPAVPPPVASIPHNMVIIDMEFTNTSPRFGKVIEIALYHPASSRSYVSYVKLPPHCKIPQVVTDLTGITEQVLQTKGQHLFDVCASVGQILDSLVLDDRVYILAHDGQRVDFVHLHSMFSKYYRNVSGCAWTWPLHWVGIDTLQLCRTVYNVKEGCGMDALVESSNWCHKKSLRHRALGDAIILFDLLCNDIIPYVLSTTVNKKRSIWRHFSKHMNVETPLFEQVFNFFMSKYCFI